MMLSRVPDGSHVQLGSLPVFATVVRRSPGSVTVEIMNGNRTTWSPMAIVAVLDNLPCTTAEPQEEDAAPRKPAKPPAGKDIFGVKMGTAAARVNAYVTSGVRWCTLETILENTDGTNKSGVKSHVRRLERDGYLKYSEKRDAWKWTKQTHPTWTE